VFALRGLDPDERNRAECAFKIAESYGLKPVVTSVVRGWAEQGRLRERWESGLSAFPANKPGDSAHQWGRCF